MQEARPTARQNSASAAVQRSYFHLINPNPFEVGEKKKQRQKAGRLGSLSRSTLTRKPATKKESEQKDDRCTSNFISNTSLPSGNPLPPYVPMAHTYKLQRFSLSTKENVSFQRHKHNMCFPPQPSAQKTQKPENFKLSNNFSLTSERSEETHSKIIKAQSQVHSPPLGPPLFTAD